MTENLMKLKKMLCSELEDYASYSGKMSAGTLDMIDKLAHAAKNVCKIIEADEDEEYSRAAGGSYRRSYADGSFMDGADGDGSYRRGRGRYANRDAMGRYSSGGYSRHGDDELHEIANQLRSMAKDLPQPTQRAIQSFVESVD